jgi:hypothetical protein
MNELKLLWQKFLGPLPSDDQWVLWFEMHVESVVRRGILQTAQKDLTLNRTMTLDYKIRFASKVMIDATARGVENAARREQLQKRFGGVR